MENEAKDLPCLAVSARVIALICWYDTRFIHFYRRISVICTS